MPPPITPLDELLTQLERRLIEQALHRARQNKSRAADLLAISRPRLYRRIKELGLPDMPEATDEARKATLRPAGLTRRSDREDFVHRDPPARHGRFRLGDLAAPR